jgi:hypothetical protein
MQWKKTQLLIRNDINNGLYLNRPSRFYIINSYLLCLSNNTDTHRTSNKKHRYLISNTRRNELMQWCYIFKWSNIITFCDCTCISEQNKINHYKVMMQSLTKQSFLRVFEIRYLCFLLLVRCVSVLFDKHSRYEFMM